jgi:multidrug efflux pump subunit AcrA (membrane-fusion protein)
VVSQQTLTSQTSVSATLGYAGSYQVSGTASGTITWLPPAGRVIRDGRVLYQVGNGTPVLLLYGRVPAWRTLEEGNSGKDVTQLNHDLVKLGYADSGDIATLGRDYFSWATKYGLEQLQDAAGISSPSGTLALGSAVFEPAAIRVTRLTARLGGPGTGPILSATSDRHVVTISLDASEQSEVNRGDAVSVTLPDGTSTPGVVSSVGRVASGSGGSAKITVQVRLRHPGAAGRLDQAPVTVYITTDQVRNVLVVPVAALLARASGGYAVEVVSGARHHLVKVSPGLFDDRSGNVQVSGNLAAGQRVVVPAT